MKLITSFSNNFCLYKDIDLIKNSEIKDQKNVEISLIDIYNTVNKYYKNKLDLIKFIYLNRLSFHNILYKYEKIIRLNYEDEKEENLSYYFYLSLLIRDNDDIINYSYPLEYIKQINSNSKKYNDKYNKLIISKIIIELINNYKELYEYEYNCKYIKLIEDECNKIIYDNINIFNDLDINLNYEDLIEKKIDEIYSQIIISLIKKYKFENYEYTYNIIKQLNLESIDITNTIYEEILNLLDNDENIQNKYKISNIEDLFDDEKLNFYYILLNYILKDTYFIYQIKYLSKIRIFILKNLKVFSPDFKKINNNQEMKLNKIIEIIFDSKYYINKYNKLKEYNLNDNETNDKNKEKFINNNKEENYLNHSNTENIKNTSTRLDTSNNIINSNSFTNENKEITNSEGHKDEINKIQNDNIDSNTREYDNANNYNNSDIKDMKNNDSNIKENNYNSSVNIQDNNNSSDIQDNNNSSNIQDNNNNSSDIQGNNNSSNRDIFDSLVRNSIDEKGVTNITKTINQGEKQGNYSLIEIRNIIGTHLISLPSKKEEKEKNNRKVKSTADFIIEIFPIFISGGASNSLYLYNSSYSKKDELKTNDWIYNVFCSTKKNDSLKILASSKKSLYLFDEKGALIKSFVNQETNINYFIGFQENNKDNNNFYCCCEDKVVIYGDILSQIIQKKETNVLKDIATKSMIKINEYVLAIKSNKIISKGKDTLIFFNRSSKKEMDNIKINGNYSFSYTANGLVVMPKERERKEKENNNKNKVLLCACKKYIKNQKNGILLVNIKEKPDNEIEISSHFYPTYKFEVYCFCPLLKIKKNTIFKEGDIIDTDYFLVGGFDLNRCRGMIKLYKVNYGQKYNKTTIEYIQDIIFSDKFKGFKGAVSCITQSSREGDILVSCWDGNVYLFGNIDIDYYLENDKDKSLISCLTNEKNDIENN